MRVPEVIAAGADFLALEWVDAGRSTRTGRRRSGAGWPRLHAAGADAFGAFHDGPPELHIGPLGFDAAPGGDWPALYAERLVRPLITQAADRGALSSAGAGAVGRVCDRIARARRAAGAARAAARRPLGRQRAWRAPTAARG